MTEAIKNKMSLPQFFRGKSKAWLLLVPATLYVFVLMLVPMINILILSIQNKQGNYTIENFRYVLMDPTIQKVFIETIRISFIVMLICLVLGYPLAYVMTICSKKVNAVITLCVMIPFWTSLLIRTYAWTTLLQNRGVINNVLVAMGIIKDPINMCYNTTGVIIGMTYVMLPYMVLSLYPVMEGIDRNLITASSNLGANGLTTFIKVYLPLSMTGVMSGCVLVFVLNLGFYIIPALMGSPENMMVSQVISTQVSKLLNWNVASALSLVLMVLALVIIGVVQKIFKIDKLM